ncbi:MAG: HU family DNA-binding protein [Syntrophales bacterium]|jgi:DNA-binding protein HU-beta
MKKTELIADIARQARVTKVIAEKTLEAFTTSVMKSLKKGDSITLTGFGTFSASKRKARTGRNPQTGQAMRIPATSVAKFKAGKFLKQAVKK